MKDQRDLVFMVALNCILPTIFLAHSQHERYAKMVRHASGYIFEQQFIKKLEAFFTKSFWSLVISWRLLRKFSLPKNLDTILPNVVCRLPVSWLRQNNSWSGDVTSTWKSENTKIIVFTKILPIQVFCYRKWYYFNVQRALCGSTSVELRVAMNND